MSEQTKEKFITELKAKLNQKASGHLTEEIILFRAFRYFDLNNGGTVDFDKFEKAIRKVGLYSMTSEEIKRVFDMYVEKNSNELNYKNFTSNLYLIGTNEENPANEKPKEIKKIEQNEEIPVQNGPKKEFLEQDNVETILNKIRNKLKERGVTGICKIAKNFRIVDKNGSQTIDLEEFKTASKEFNFGLNDDEIKKAFLAFDRDDTGIIDYDEFLRGIRGNMNEFRQNLVKQAFNILDTNKSGEITFDEIKSKYNARMHKDVKEGRRTEDEVLKEFMDTFQDTYNYLCGTENDEKISIDEFMEYYENVSMSIDDDSYFELMMNNAWRMNDNTTYNNEKKGWSNKEKNQDPSNPQEKNLNIAYQDKFGAKRPGQTDEEYKKDQDNLVIKKIKKEILLKGKGGIINLRRFLKTFESDKAKCIEFAEFKKALKEADIKLNDEEIKKLFEKYDTQKINLINYDELLKELRGKMNNQRCNVVKKAFNKLDVEGSGILNINEVKNKYNAKNNKLVKTGKKSEGDVYQEFIESFQNHHNLHSGVRTKRVDLNEFLDYYNDISMFFDNDDNFINEVITTWNLEPKKKGERLNSIKASYNTPYGNDFVNNETAEKKIDSSPLIDKFRDILAKRGSRGIMGIRRQFMIADDNNSKTLDIDEFKKFCKDFRMGFTEIEIEDLFNSFDIDNSNNIHYEEFLRLIVGEMNEQRKNIVRQAFNKLDKNKNGMVEIDDIRQFYNAKKHPDVVKGKKTEDEILGEFLDNLEYQFSLLNENKTKDKKISIEEFFEYYNNISMSIDRDDYFIEMVKGCWDLDQRKTNSRSAWRGEI